MNLHSLIIVDQANSLKPNTLCTVIHLFNELEGILDFVLLGTENLKYQIKKGARLNKIGFDEVDSRFGRRYVHLVGATLSDTRKICAINGITDKALQNELFLEAEPVYHTIQSGDSKGKQIRVVKDKRMLKRKSKREVKISEIKQSRTK